MEPFPQLGTTILQWWSHLFESHYNIDDNDDEMKHQRMRDLCLAVKFLSRCNVPLWFRVICYRNWLGSKAGWPHHVGRQQQSQHWDQVQCILLCTVILAILMQ